MKASLLGVALAGLCVAGLTAGSAGAAEKYLNLTSPDFKDGGKLPNKYSGKNAQNANCTGDNISPALNWTGAPAKTQSYAIMLFDTAGRAPLGVVHWLAYGIPASKTGFKEGEAAQPPNGFMGGKSTMNLPSYFGPLSSEGRQAASLRLHPDGDRPRAGRAPGRHGPSRARRCDAGPPARVGEPRLALRALNK